MRAGRYGGILIATVGLLGATAAYAYLAMREGRAGNPLETRLEDTGENGVVFTVRNRWQIRPDQAAFERMARADTAWWRTQSVPSDRYTTTIATGVLGLPPVQAMRDTVWRLTQLDRLNDAADVLRRWVRTHPGDRAATLELARLTMRTGRTDESLAHYRRLVDAGAGAELRREYAAALLASGRHADAARIYATLLAGDRESLEYRLGLARALAWDGRAREAERELRVLAARLPGDTAIAAMLRSARTGFDPAADEARAWVASAPDHLPYRLALARALAREGRAGEAAAQFDTLLTRGATELLAEAAGAHAAAGDSAGTARLLARAVLVAPADTSLRRRFAEALAWSGDRQAAIAQYSQLLAAGERADLLLARGRLRAWNGELASASADLARAAELEPSYEALVLLGDVERWRGRHGEARRAWTRALALRPGDPTVLASLASLAHEERLLAVAGTSGDGGTGWTATASYAEDNAGFLYLASGLTRGFAMGRATVVSATVEQRRVSHRSAREPERYVYGVALGAGASHWLGRALRASVQGGVVRHGIGGDVGYGSLAVESALPRGASATVQVGTGPVYGSLMSLRALAEWRAAEFEKGRPLTGRTMSAAVTVPVGRVSVTAGVEELRLADGNRRRAVTASARLPIGGGFSALYSGGTMGYDGRSDVYWDPARYTSHSAGLEYAWSGARGVRLAARVLPGVGRTSEALVAPNGDSRRLDPVSAPQLSTSGEASIRRGRWDVGVSGGYGRGREGGYQSLNGALRVRLDW